MQLDNPKQERSLSEILAALPETTKQAARERIMRSMSAMARQFAQDAEIVASVCRILESPVYSDLANRLRKLIKGKHKC